MAKKIAALVGLDNPHSSGWLTLLKNLRRIGRVVACPLDGETPEADAVYAHVGTMLAQEEIDVAIVCTRNVRAPELVARLLRAGIPTVAEKPVARTAGEIRRLVRIAHDHRVPFAAAFQNRFQPIAQEFQRIARGGALGRIVSIEANMVTSTVHQRNPRHWLFDHSMSGGGILHWLACHTFDLIRFITGLEYQTVMAKVGTLSGEPITVEDVAAVCFEMSNGAVGTLHAGYVLRTRYGDIGLRVRGTLGEAAWPMFGFQGRGDTLHIRSDARGWETVARKDITAPYREEPAGYGGSLSEALIYNVLAAAERKERLFVSGMDAFRTMQVIQAAYLSSRTGKQIRIRP